MLLFMQDGKNYNISFDKAFEDDGTKDDHPKINGVPCLRAERCFTVKDGDTG